MIVTSWTITAVGFKNASYNYTEELLIVMTLKTTLENPFIRNLKQRRCFVVLCMKIIGECCKIYVLRHTAMCECQELNVVAAWYSMLSVRPSIDCCISKNKTNESKYDICKNEIFGRVAALKWNENYARSR